MNVIIWIVIILAAIDFGYWLEHKSCAPYRWTCDKCKDVVEGKTEAQINWKLAQHTCKEKLDA